MVVAFHANCVAIEEMDGFWLIGFADEKFGTRYHLTLQRSHEDDEQDTRLGMNTYHIERDGQGWSCYGGIERFELHRDRVVVRLTGSGAERLGTEGMVISFTTDDGRFGLLKQGLEHVFAGTDCLVILT